LLEINSTKKAGKLKILKFVRDKLNKDGGKLKILKFMRDKLNKDGGKLHNGKLHYLY
jgi:hypothetical protein